jgi:hypothetical protein
MVRSACKKKTRMTAIDLLLLGCTLVEEFLNAD